VSMRRRTTVGLVLGLAAVCLPPSSQAAPPIIERSSNISGSVENVQDCGDGTRVDLEFNFDEVFKLFSDRSGELIRVTRWARGSGTLLLVEEDTGEILATETGASPNIQTLDLRNNTFSVAGMTLHNNVPGSGRVAHASGRVIWEVESFNPETFDLVLGDVIKSAGKQQEFNEIDWCQILRDQM
jgi:hypothetical protein